MLDGNGRSVCSSRAADISPLEIVESTDKLTLK